MSFRCSRLARVLRWNIERITMTIASPRVTFLRADLTPITPGVRPGHYTRDAIRRAHEEAERPRHYVGRRRASASNLAFLRATGRA